MVPQPSHLQPSGYYAFSTYLKQRFGQRIHKVTVDSGFTCPNRDGSLGRGGCIFCNNESFSRGSRTGKSVYHQVEEGIVGIRRRFGVDKFIAYFQPYTNTYASIGKLEQLYTEALQHPDIVGIAIGTRPDCVGEKVLDVLERIVRDGWEVWLELGLQSGSNETLDRINRGHTVENFLDAVDRGKRRGGIKLCAHLILGFPWETPAEQLSTAVIIADSGIHGLKLHALHVVKGTALEKTFKDGELDLPTRQEYITLVCDFLERIPPDIVIQRLSSEAHEDLLIAPPWCGRNQHIPDAVRIELESRGSWQGKWFRSDSSDSRSSEI